MRLDCGGERPLDSIDQIPVRQLASADDIAAAVAFLAGPGSGAVIGQVLQPNGGVTRTRA